MKIGNEDIIAVYYGEDEVTAIVQGEDEVIYSGATPSPVPAEMWFVDDITADKSNGVTNETIELPFIITTGTSIRMQYELYTADPNNGNIDAIGYWEDNPVGVSDNDDWRPIIWDNGGIIFDLNYDRLWCYYDDVHNYFQANTDYDMTFGDFYIYDNTNDYLVNSGSPVGSVGHSDINTRLNVGRLIVKGLQVYEGTGMTHDYRPAVMSGFTYGEEPWTHIGFWDDVENVFVYDSGVSMWYNASCEQDPQCVCERMGPDYHWDPVNETCIQWGPEQECNASGQYWSGILNQCFETEEEMLAAECAIMGGVWEWDEEMQSYTCHPGSSDDPCEGYSSQEECDCAQMGGEWDGVECIFPEPDPCEGMSPEECDCINQGGTWDPDGEQCNLPDPCMGDPECECTMQGGTWDPNEGVCLQA